jgi:hypothetical protein
MTIRRDDLVAAASAGLLQYRQIDPLLVFLLQRDVVAKRQAMLEQTRKNRQSAVNRLLSYIVGLLAMVTAMLFGLLLVTRAAPAIGSGAFAFLSALYLLAVLGVTTWFRKHGLGGRIRLLAAVILTATPLAVFALRQVAE